MLDKKRGCLDLRQPPFPRWGSCCSGTTLRTLVIVRGQVLNPTAARQISEACSAPTITRSDDIGNTHLRGTHLVQGLYPATYLEFLVDVPDVGANCVVAYAGTFCDLLHSEPFGDKVKHLLLARSE